MLVSGGAAVTPFTTPEDAAASGLPAGNTLTAIRSRLLDAGLTAFTAPASLGGGPVESDDGWQGFARAPIVLPAEVTVNAVGGIDAGGERLDAFLRLLGERQGIDEVDVVAHSMGGLFTRAAIRIGRESGAPRIRRLITLGTPWGGSLLGDFAAGDIALDDAGDDARTRQILEGSARYAFERSQGAAAEVSRSFLVGDAGWNARQAGVLDDVEVALVAGDGFSATAGPESVWPHDGLVSARSALAAEVPASVLPRAARATFPDVHSVFFADLLDLTWDHALTWDPAVLDLVVATLAADVPAATRHAR